MAVADTSWVYALLNGNDPHHDKAKADAAKHERVHLPPAVLAELLGLIQFRSGGVRGRAREALDALESTGNFVFGEPVHDHETTMRVWDVHDRLSYIDASAIAAARRTGLSLLTFDKAQLKAHRSGRP